MQPGFARFACRSYQGQLNFDWLFHKFFKNPKISEKGLKPLNNLTAIDF
jgi:hypothetical protein